MGNQWQARSRTHTSIASSPVSKGISWKRSFPSQNTYVQSQSEDKADEQVQPRRQSDNVISRLNHSLDLPYALKPIQTKLTVGAPGDKYEQEADRVADQVMSMGDRPQSVQREVAPEEEVQTKAIAASITPLVQREMAPEEEEVQPKLAADSIQREEMPEEEEVQTKPLGDIQREEMPEEEEPVQTKPSLQRSPDGNLQVGEGIESRLSQSKGGGSPLSDNVRAFMEPRFGADFSQVRVHTGSEAVQMNRDLNAQAFTHKQDVYFGAGKTPGKDALTAHELTHVIQQTGSAQTNLALRTPSIQRKCSACEKEDGQIRLKGNLEHVGNPSSIATLKEINSQTSIIQRADGPCEDIPAHIPHHLIVRGSVHPDVREAQRKLNQFHQKEQVAGKPGLPSTPLVPDCIFGSNTFKATLAFQQQRFPNQPHEHDGKIGDHTWAELDKASNTIEPPQSSPPQPNSVELIKNVNLTVDSKPDVTSKLNESGDQVIVTIDNFLLATGTAEVESGLNCNKFVFGFFQIGRPFDVSRVVYRNLQRNSDFIADGSDQIRSQEPCPDVQEPGDPWSFSASPRCSQKGSVARTKLGFSDKPSTSFPTLDRNLFFIRNLSWQASFFNTFSAQHPDGRIQHLKSFFWDIQFCKTMNLPSPEAPLGTVAETRKAVNINGVVDGAPNEPGISMVGKPTSQKTCNQVVKSANFNVVESQFSGGC